MSHELTSGQDRYAKWERRYDPEHIKVITEAEKPIYAQHAQTVFAQQYEMDLAVKQVLDNEGVSVAVIGDLLSFSRQLWKAQRTHSGETLSLEAANYVSLWVARGMAQSVLEKIRDQVFHIPAPAAPVE